MGKKAKVGKQRKDKYYFLAKDTGYRSRSAFKLLQLNRKFEFLQKSRVLIDLCAAPGGWLQVANKTMPVSSVVIGVDLHPIRPIPRVTTFVADITTEKCRQNLRKELHHWKADCVLHDGAPNVGTNWYLDAHNQALLTLQATKIASEYLIKGGWFITKVFRSRDYQSLIWVFNQLFRKVHATKPQASRYESAEIFVVCQDFIAPDKIDPKFFDSRHIFKELPVEEAKKKMLILQNPSKAKKVKAEGYEEGEMTLYHRVNMSDFINSEEPVKLLNNCSELVFDLDEINSHRLTTVDIRECAKDIKVLGRKEIRMLLTWQKNMRTVLEKVAKLQKDKIEKEVRVEKEAKDEDSDDGSIDDEELQKTISELKEKETKEARRLQKTAVKKKRKVREKLQKLGMMQIAVDEEDGGDEQVFKLQQIKSKDNLTELEKGDLSFLDKEDEEPDLLNKRESKLVNRRLVDPMDPDDDGYEDEDSGDDVPSDLDEEEKEMMKLERAKRKQKKEDGEGSSSDMDSDSDLESSNPLLTDLDYVSETSRAQRTTSLWFSKEVFEGMDGDDDEDLEISQMSNHYMKLGGTIKEKPATIEESEEIEDDDDAARTPSSRRVSFNTTIFSMDDSGNRKEEKLSDDDEDDDEDDDDLTPGSKVKGAVQNGDVDDDSDSESDYDDDVMDAPLKQNSKKTKGQKKSAANKDGFEIVSSEPPAKKGRKLDPCGLAIGEQIATSMKKRREIIDHGYHKYVYGEEVGLPDWFVKSERTHCRRIMPVTKAQIAVYRARLREINARPIKKVAEAKARKKLRYLRKVEKLKKKAEALGDTIDTSEKEKYSHLKALYKKAGLDGKRTKQVTYVVAKKGLLGKRVKRPRGLKGPFRMVDPRMKTEIRAKKAADTKRKKKIKKRQR